jgi:HD-GYP domain-containing protein (c-di-GMP phosphodiesterase class II)
MNIKMSGRRNYFRPSIAKRMAVTLTLFGIVIGYLAFIMLFIMGTGDIVYMASKRFEESIYSFLPQKSTDPLFSLLEREDTEALKFKGIFKKIASGLTSIDNINFYFKDKGLWYKFAKGDGGMLHTMIIEDKALIKKLQKCLVRKKTISGQFFFGSSDIVSVMDNLTRDGDNKTVVLTYDIVRPSIISFIRQKPLENFGFFISLLFFSFLIGMIFSRGITKPLEELSNEASAMASGDLGRVFPTKSKDEIGRLARTLSYMAERIRAAMKEREELMMGIMTALTRSIDAKSEWTAGHSERVTKYAELIGRKLKLTDDELRNLMISAILHDIGKIAVPEGILDKPGRLTEEEFSIVRKHPDVGANIIEDIPAYSNEILPGILHHHERWDGNGYPTGLEGESIPLFARIIAVADVFDAISAERPYRKAMNKEEVEKFIRDNMGKMFDPEITELFISIILDMVSKEKQ